MIKPEGLIFLGLAIIVSLVVILPFVHGNDMDDLTLASTGPKVHKSKLEKLIDWDTYKKIFNKRYSSMRQQMARQKIFMASAMDVFKKSVRYMVYLTSYYTSINKFSDLAHYEIERIISGDKHDVDKNDFTDDLMATILLVESLDEDGTINANNVDELLKKERNEAINKNKHKWGLFRGKRSFGERRRYFNPDYLLAKEDKDTFTLDGNENYKLVIPSNNPFYEKEILNQNTKSSLTRMKNRIRMVQDIPVDQIDKASRKKVNGIFNASLFMVKAGLSKLVDELDDHLQKLSSSEPDSDSEVPKKESKKSYLTKDTIVLRDWTDSGCIGPVRNQEICNSCYAMSTTGYMEWSLCMDQGRVLTPLSPQYTISCGPQYSQEMDGQVKLYGCTFGSSKGAIDFIREYGLELETNMQYFDYDTECPIPTNTPRKKKGYIRPNVNNLIRLNAKTTRLDLALKAGPVVVSMRVPRDFTDYAGGILDYCDSNSGHSMLIVGNAIEDNVEYLLIKNSFGTGWGYDGYLKFKRSAAEHCVKEYISPSISFPSFKSKERHIKAYLASKGLVSGNEEHHGEFSKESSNKSSTDDSTGIAGSEWLFLEDSI